MEEVLREPFLNVPPVTSTAEVPPAEGDFPIKTGDKAFDSVCHRKLLAKLEWYGIRDPLLKCFNSYHIGRLQRAVLNGLYSNWNEVKSEFLRSLFLSLLCFFCFVNDMPNFVTGTTLAMFADDSKCYKCNESPDDFDTIQTDLNHLRR